MVNKLIGVQEMEWLPVKLCHIREKVILQYEYQQINEEILISAVTREILNPKLSAN